MERVQLFRSEQLKFFYNRWIRFAGLATIGLVSVLVVVLNGFSVDATPSFNQILNQILQSCYLGQVGFTVITVLYFGQEFSHSALRTSLLASPQRWRFLGVKFISLSFWNLLLWFVLSFLVILTVSSVWSFHWTLQALSVVTLRLFLVYGAALLLNLLTASLIVIFKNSLVALASVLAGLLGLGQLLLSFHQGFRYLPILATLNVFYTPAVPAYLPVGYGLFIQGLWCAGFALIAAGLLKRRTVS